jgi:2-polyprenyl-6-methoxyphenol hydroxylase-like FAD-dependent oxidoreductase
VVVGAGPAGLTAAIALARLGVEVLLVERRRELSSLPRATAVSTRSMEIFRSWGLEDDIRAREVDVRWQMWFSPTLAEAASGQGIAAGFPTSDQSAVISPTSPACLPQDQLEPVLFEHLRTLPAARVKLGTEVVAVTSEPGGVDVVLRDAAGGEERTVEARYLVAADGAHSVARTELEIPMRGPDHLTEAVSALFEAPLWDVVGEHRYGLYVVQEPEEGMFLPSGREDRWLYGAMWEPGERRVSDFTPERITELIELGAGVEGLRPRIERIGSFTFAAQMADAFRRDSAFLIGDAAHRVTPRGGTGMNTAIHDGYDLGWKLAWVMRGWAGDDLLDTYEAERRPVAEHNVERSADPNGSRRDATRELRVDLGARIPHVWVPTPAGLVSTLDLLGPGLTLLTGPGGCEVTAIDSPTPVEVRQLDEMTARALGIAPGGSLLVRPDGTPTAVEGARPLLAA